MCMQGAEPATEAFGEKMEAARRWYCMRCGLGVTGWGLERRSIGTDVNYGRPGAAVNEAAIRMRRLLKGIDVEQCVREHEGGLAALGPGDSDEWLNVTSEQVEAMWREHAGPSGVAVAEEAVRAMQSFLTGMQSDYEGIEAPADVSLDVQGLLDSLRGLLAVDDTEGDEDLDEFLGDDLEESIAEDFSEYYDGMDRELHGTKVAEGFVTAQEGRAMAGDENGDATEDGDAIHVELNLLKNMFESYSAQQGLAGPVGNIMRSLGHALPDDDPDELEDQ